MSGEILAKAIAIASDKHMGQYDKSGTPYILHPLKVMHYLRTDDYELMAIAVLHDVVEDTNTTYEYLIEHGMSARVIDALKLLTKVPGQTYREYIDLVKTNLDAVLVKLADLRHNSDIRRIKGLTQKDFDRMRKYNEIYVEVNEIKNNWSR